MKKLNILGYSQDILSMILETIWQKYEHSCNVDIISNIPFDLPINPKFAPSNIRYSLNYVKSINFKKSNNNILGVFTPSIKSTVFQYFLENYDIHKDQYISLIHPESWLASSCTVEKGVYIEPRSVISPFATIGFSSSINRNVSIGHHSQIDEFVTISPGVNIGGHTKIGRCTQIGIGATIFNKISIGENSIIGGGSVVVKNIPPNSIAYGNPCKVIRKNK